MRVRVIDRHIDSCFHSFSSQCAQIAPFEQSLSHRIFENHDQSVTINSVMNIVSLLELLMGVGIAKTAPYKKKRRKRTDKIAIPTDR